MATYRNSIREISDWEQFCNQKNSHAFMTQFRRDMSELNADTGFLESFLQQVRPNQLKLVQQIFPNYEDINIELAEKIILTDISDVTVEYLRKDQPTLFNMLEMWYVEGILRNANLWNDTMKNLFEHM